MIDEPTCMIFLLFYTYFVNESVKVFVYSYAHVSVRHIVEECNLSNVVTL